MRCSYLILTILMLVAITEYPAQAREEIIELSSSIDPAILPYKLVNVFTGENQAFFVSIGQPNQEYIGVVQQNWRPNLSAIVFYSVDSISVEARKQFNFDTEEIKYWHAHDWDRDGIQEVAVTYVKNDTAFVEIVDALESFRYRRAFGVCEDLNGDGFWGGTIVICHTHYDLNGDGYSELMLLLGSGYDLYPRRLYCLDWMTDSILWHFDYAGNAPNRGPNRIVSPDQSDTSFVFSCSALSNGYEVNSMKDSEGYLISIDSRGNLKWLTTIANGFAPSVCIEVDFDTDSIMDILAINSIIKDDNSFLSKLMVYDIHGEARDSFSYDYQVLNTGKINYKGEEVIYVCLSNGGLKLYSLQFELLAHVNFDTNVNKIRKARLTGSEKEQFVVFLNGAFLHILSEDFEPLALISNLRSFDRPVYLNEKHSVPGLLINRLDGRWAINVMKKNPWNAIFSRKPILAFLAAFIPLVLSLGIIGYAFYSRAKISRKNQIIEKQRQKLDSSLNELKETQDKLIASEKYRQAKGIAGGVTHEIRNSLYPAMSALEKLALRLEDPTDDDPDRNRKLLHMAQRAVERANSMTELVRQYSRLESEKKGDIIDLEEVVQQVVSENQDRIDNDEVKVALDFNGTLPIRANRLHLYSLFNNLLLNSLDALEERESKQISISLSTEYGRLKISFEDSGSGIDEDDLDKVYDTFFSTKPNSGTGLGLSTVKKIVDLYEGNIRVESQLGRGTSFYIDFPNPERGVNGDE
ncbi:MAG: GHKL domain-containing protein [candidate division Zixibacteria bacterium]|nr:GHKL domain-containing protein [candidate division Zixibacteria bacterium]